MMRNNYQQSEDSVTKISRSKSRNQVKAASKLKQKESGWNERFHLNHIPEYNYQNEPHSQYLKNKFRIPNRKDPSRAKRLFEPSLQKNKVSNKPNPLKNELKLKEAITNAFSELREVWYSKQIPECHMEAMTEILNRENNPMKLLDDLKHEYSEIVKETSLIQKITSSIEEREACVEKITELIANFQNTDRAKIARNFEERITQLRILTIHCIQCIFHWKQSIQTLGPKGFKVKYTTKGELYTKKVKEDYKNIIKSNFKEIFQFQAQKIDAFFLNYTLDGRKVLSVSKNLIKRIRLCEIMLNEEDQNVVDSRQVLNSNKKTTAPPKQKQNRDKSVPPRKSQTIEAWVKVPVQYGQFGDYVTNIHQKNDLKQSFLGQLDFTKYEEITIFRFSETQQEIILGVDKMASQRRIVISVIKSNLEGVQRMLKSFAGYLWENDYCTQIRVPLVHIKSVDKLSVDVELQKKLKLVGFRWTCVNHSNETRTTIYAMKRPLDTVAHKTSRRTQKYPVVIEHLVNFSLLQKKQKKHPSRCFPAVLDIIRSLKDFQAEDYDELVTRDQFSHHLECIKRVSKFILKQEGQKAEDFFSYSGMKSFLLSNDETLQKVFKNVEIPAKKAKAPSVINLVNSCFKFNHITIQDGKYTKFFPTKDNQILIVESNYPIYLLQTDEQNINFFVIEVSEGFSMESIETIFNGMGEQSSFKDEFWLPTFSKSEDYIDEVGFASTEVASTNYRNSLGSLTRKSKVRTKIIKPPFVFGMINKKLLEMLEIPFYCTLVRKQDLL